jgi:hypothetical protein
MKYSGFRITSDGKMTSVKLTRHLSVRSLHRDIHFLMVHVIIIVFSSQLHAQYCAIHIRIVTSFR